MQLTKSKAILVFGKAGVGKVRPSRTFCAACKHLLKIPYHQVKMIRGGTLAVLQSQRLQKQPLSELLLVSTDAFSVQTKDNDFFLGTPSFSHSEIPHCQVISQNLKLTQALALHTVIARF